MKTSSILKPELMSVIDEITQQIYYGCDQDWYPTTWQKNAGCAPTVASCILFYLRPSSLKDSVGFTEANKRNCLMLMQAVWEYVTPGERGIPSTVTFAEAVLDFARSKGMDMVFNRLDVPEQETSRPAFPILLDFIESSLNQDVPLAFLNLCNGAETHLERWHWVTIVAMTSDREKEAATIYMLDQGRLVPVDLRLWYNTTTKGGGFVSFNEVPDCSSDDQQGSDDIKPFS